MPNWTSKVLLVDDDDLEAMIVIRCLRKLGIETRLVHEPDGEKAIDYLNNCGSDLPCLILLDINMPRMDGFEVLSLLGVDDTMKNIPVIMFSSSSEDSDRRKSYELGAVGYIVKKSEPGDFMHELRRIQDYCTTKPPCPEAHSSCARYSEVDSTVEL